MIRTPGADLDRLQDPEERPDDEVEVRLRPRRLDEFVGQEALKTQLRISIRGRRRARRGARARPARRPAGTGQDVARPDHRRGARRRRSCRPRARRSSARRTSRPSCTTCRRARSSSSTRSTGCRARSRRPSIPAMEDRQLPITVGVGAGAKVVTLDLPRVHADRRHHALRAADDAVARPLRHPAPP